MTLSSQPKKWTVGRMVVSGVVLAVVVYVFFPIQCPYCHNSDANVKGACVKRLWDGSCSEDYYETHFNLSSCPWCKRKGWISRIGAFLESMTTANKLDAMNAAIPCESSVQNGASGKPPAG